MNLSCAGGSEPVSAIQAAIIEDLGDPKGPQLGRGATGHSLPPRARLGSELMGLAFMRSFHGDPDQRAWETCTDPMKMMYALAMVGEAAPIRVITKGIERFIATTRTALRGSWEAAQVLHGFDELLGASTSIKEVAEAAIVARGFLDQHQAGAILAHDIYLVLPVAPHRFSEEPLEDEEMVRRLGTLTARLQLPEQRWLEELGLQVLRKAEPLTPSQRNRVDSLLRSRGAWKVFTQTW